MEIQTSLGQITNGMNAADLLGQYTTAAGFTINWTQATANNNQASVNALGMSLSDGIAIDYSGHRMFTADPNNNRVLVYNLNASNILVDKTPDFVLGQSSFTTNTAATTATGMRSPYGVVFDANNNRLFVAEYFNNRVSVYDVAAITNGEAAVNVLGQSSFTTSTAATSASGITGPDHLALDATNNRLFITEWNNNRVLVFDIATITNGEAAVNVLGQSSFTTSTAATTATGMRNPLGIAYDDAGNRLFVTDYTNNRVLVFDATTITNGEAAVNVLGQTTFTTSTAATSQTGIQTPGSANYDATNNRLFITEWNNNRVLVFDVAVITNGEAAVNVLGQSSFTTTTAATTQSGLKNPDNLFYDGTNGLLYVSDATNNRIVVYNAAPLLSVSGTTTNVTCATPTSGAISLTVSGGVAPYTYAWSNSATTQNLTGLSAGTYTVTVTDATSVTTIESVTLSTPINISNGMNASELLGQYTTTAGFTNNYTQATINNNNGSTYGLGFNLPLDIEIDAVNHRAFVADLSNNRVLVFNLDASNNLVDKTPDFVLGQANFTANAIATTQAGMNGPVALLYDATGNRLFVADYYNSRVLVFDVATITNGENAISVLGQANFTTATAATTQAGMSNPQGLTFDAANSRLFVANGNRVTVYDVAAITNGENAINVLGQSNFTTATAATTQSGMNSPDGLAYDATNSRLFVGENNNNRVLVFDVAAISNGENAINVLGQSNFTTATAAITQSGMSNVRGLEFNASTQLLFVVNSASNRILVFDVATITDGENAVNMLGQTNFTTGTSGVTQSKFSFPENIYFNSNNSTLYVADRSNNRVVVYCLFCPLSVTSTVTNITCTGGNTGAINLTVSGGVAPYAYAWSNGATTQNLTGLQAGTYSVTITDIVGSTATTSATVSALNIGATITGAISPVSTPSGTDGAIDLTVSGGSSPYTYNWSNGKTTQDISSLSAGNYTVTVTESNGCISNKTFNVLQGIANKQLYLSDPSQALDRIDPVASADATTAQTSILSTTSTTTSTITTTLSTTNYQGAANTNYGSCDYLLLEAPSNFKGYGFVKFDISSIPSGATITSASLRLVHSDGFGIDAEKGAAFTTTVRRLTRDWTEGTACNTSQAGSLTWNSAGSANWTTAGGDFAATSYGTFTGGAPDAEGTIYTLNVLSLVNEWFSGTSQNYGLGLVPTTGNGDNDWYYIWSEDAADATKRPQLIVTYTLPGTTTTTFTQNPSLCSNLTIKAGQPVTVKTYTTVTSGSMPTNPSITATLKYGSTTIATMSSPSYNASAGTLTWTTTLGSDVTIPAGQAIVLDITTAQSGVAFTIDYDSQADPSLIELPVSTYIDVTSLGMYTAPFPGGTLITSAAPSSTVYLRAVVNDPFGFSDITGMNIGIIAPGGTTTNVTGTSVATSGCTRTYEYTWAAPATSGAYSFNVHAKEGLENAVMDAGLLNFTVTVPCVPIPVRAPLGMIDNPSTLSSTAVTINVLSNDNNVTGASVSISTAPSAAQGVATLSGNNIIFTPNPTFNGEATFQYTVTTAAGSDIVPVFVQVNNTPVVAVNDAPASALSGTTQTINVKANDTDTEQNATVSVTIAPKNGTTTVNGSGNVLYTPSAGFVGVDTFFYALTEPTPTCGPAYAATARVIVTVTNRPPVASNDNFNALVCISSTFNLFTNDSDPEGGVVSIASMSALSNPAAGTLANNNDGTVTFTPATGFSGSVTFTYTINDDNTPVATSAAATVTITVAAPPTNNAPVANRDYLELPLNSVFFQSVVENDTDPNNHPLTNPTITVNALNGSAIVLSNGLIQYTPNTGFLGLDSVQYSICDIINNPATCSTGSGLCSTAFSVFKVLPLPIDAKQENGTVTLSGGTAILNVRSNDLINNNPATSANSTIAESGTWPTGISLNTATGAVNVVAGTPFGTYPVYYEICNLLTPTACVAVLDTVFITPQIQPITESGSVPATGGTPIANVRSNDTVNGTPATSSNSTIAQIGTWPSGISLNTTSGAITVASGTTPGVYAVTYQLCDLATPTPNCATVVDNITVTPVISPITESGSAPATGGTPIANVRSNDTVNGTPATSSNSTIAQIGTWPSGISLNTTSGAITVASGTTPGVYAVTYQLCDLATPTPNCATVVDNITVTPVISPITESGSVPATGGTPIANVRSNDMVNGTPATSSNSTIAQIGTWPSGISLNTTSGAITVASGTTPGVYAVTYQLCDLVTPTPNCATVVDNINVNGAISPVTESGSVPATGGTPIANVRSNDTVNGTPATSSNSTIAQIGTWPSGISLNTTSGVITVASGTTPGVYAVTYQLCDLATPTPNCATVVDNITVTPVISPITESGTALSTGDTPIVNVRVNDTVNGIQANSSNSTIAQIGTWPSGISLNTTSGAITVASGTTPGVYAVTYQLCDLATPTPNCATVVDNITVTPVISPITESGSAPATGGTPITNVRTNDSVNGTPATSSNSTIAQIGTWPSGIALNTTSGAITVSSGTTPGVYAVTYQLCDLATPTPNCATVVDNITITPVISPITESGTALSTGDTPIVNVRVNDTVNGIQANSSNSTIAQIGTWPSGISLNTTSGAITVSSGTTPGVYAVTYQLCDLATPTPNCATVVDNITVTSVISPITESGSAPATGGTPIANVRSNDTVNGTPATSSNSTIAQIGTWPSGISLNTTSGAITVASGTTPGVYAVTYQLCDLATPTPNCATVVDNITVTPVISPVTESGSVPATGGTPIANVRSNDTVNGTPATSSNSTIAQIGTWPSGISLNTTSGAITVASGMTPGVYAVTYQLCDLATPTPNCATVVDNITVTPVISPVTESGSVPATGGTPIANVRSNDTVNGTPATSSNSTIAQIGTWPSGISLNTTSGAITVASGTTPGVYAATYQLCDLATPTPNCATVVDNITVTPVISPITESGSAPATGGTPIANVRSNDTVNGTPATSSNSTIAQIGTWPSGISLNTTSGAITVSSGTTPGVYAVTYQLCDLATPTPNCATVVDNITVTPVISPITESGTALSTGDTPIVNVRVNDTVNGIQANSSNSTIAQIGTWPSGISLNTTSGAITVASGTTPGVYAVTYQLCDLATPTPNCATVVDNITVTPVISPVTESGSVPATGGTPIANVRSNDTVNGTPATSSNSTIAQIGTWPSGISLNTTSGAITVASGTTPGVYAVTYQLCDLATPTPNCATVVDNITVTAISLTTDPDFAVTNINVPVTGNVKTNDDVPTGTTYGTPVADPSNPSACAPMMSSNGTYSFVCATLGEYKFQIPVCPVGISLGCPIELLTITVKDPYSLTTAPIANPDIATIKINTPININIKANDDCNNGLTCTLGIPTIVNNPSNGTVVVNPDGTVLYTPNANFTGEDVFTYQVCDNQSPSKCDQGIVTVTVLPLGSSNSIDASDDYVNTAYNTAISSNVLANDNDPEGNTLAAVVQNVSDVNGTFSLAANGAYTFTPAAGFSGPVEYVYTVCDNGSPQACANATIHILAEPASVVSLNIKVLLQGAMLGTSTTGGTGGSGTSVTMRDDLRVGNYIPLSDPYRSSVYNTEFLHVANSNTQTTNSTVLANTDANNSIVDWVFIELRNATNPSSVVATMSALVQRDGDVVASGDGTSSVIFDVIPANYYVAIRHRNHLGAMTSSAIPIGLSSTLVDFTSMTDAQVYNNTATYDGYEMTTINGKRALWAGNSNMDIKVKYAGLDNDSNITLTEVLTHPSNVNLNYSFNNCLGYFRGDVNMDGKSKYSGLNNDINYILNNVYNYGLNTARNYSYNIMLEQLP